MEYIAAQQFRITGSLQRARTIERALQSSSVFFSQVPGTTTPLQYLVCIEYDGPLGFRLIRKGGSWSVVEVLPRSQAQLSGVDIGDTVVSINGLDVPSTLEESHPVSCRKRSKYAFVHKRYQAQTCDMLPSRGTNNEEGQHATTARTIAKCALLYAVLV